MVETESAKGADARRRPVKEFAGALGGKLATAAVLRAVFQNLRRVR